MSYTEATYQHTRDRHFGRATGTAGEKIANNMGESMRVHATITRIVAKHGIEFALKHPYETRLLCRTALGVYRFTPAFLSLVLQLLKILLPIFLQWLDAENDSSQRLFGNNNQLRMTLERWAEELP